MNGFLFGLALAAGLYLPGVLALGRSPVGLGIPVAVLGGGLIVVIGAIAGWLGTRFAPAYAAPLVWIGGAGLIILVAGHMPYEGKNLVVWLADRRFWGRDVYPFDGPALARMLVAGFFIGLGLVILAFFQEYRLDSVRSVLNRGQLTPRAWLLLLLPLPLIAAVGYAADENLTRPLRTAPLMVDEAIQTARTYGGDLAELGRQRGINYLAINGVLDRIGQADYTLMLGALDLGPSETVFVVAHFANGAWVNCRVLAEQLSHCYDASLPYTHGLAGALSGAGTPGCQSCTVRLNDASRAWLLDHGLSETGGLSFTRLAQWGSHVLMRAEDLATGYVVECWFEGMVTPTVTGCTE